MKNIFLLLLLAAKISSAQNIAAYLSAPFPTGLTGSPTGNAIAWVFNNKGERNIYIAEAPLYKARQLTHYTGDEGIEINSLQFTPDGRRLLFIRGNSTNNDGEPANPAFLQTSTWRDCWITGTDGGGLHKIGPGSYSKISPDGKTLAYSSAGQLWTISLTDTTIKPGNLFQSRGGQTQFRWSPDGTRLAFVSNRGDHSFIGIYQFENKSVSFIETSVDNDVYPVWSPDSKYLAYIRIPNINNLLPFTPVREANPWSIRLYSLQTGEIKEIWKAAPGKGSAFFDELPVEDNLLWWGTNDQLIFPYEKDGWQHLYAFGINNGTTTLLTPGNGEVENATLSRDGQTMYYTTNIGDINRRHIWKLNLKDGKSAQLTTGTNIEWAPVITANGIALIRSSATKPAWPALEQNGSINDLSTELFPKDFPTALVQPQSVMIKATDGMQVTGDLFLPPGHKPGDKHPALIFLHGGSRRQMLLGFNYSQYYSNAYALNQYFASQGYVVIALNYRSGIGYGLDFREALNYGATGASEVRDLIGAGLYLKNRPDVDAKKIALWGGSYGGYLTAHGLSQAPDLFACGVDIHGVHNWNDEIPTFAPWYDYAKFPAIAKKALESSPVYFVKGWKNPVLLVHGDDDRNVPFNQSVNIAETLRKQGVHVEQLVLPDEIHGFLLHRSWLKVYEACFEFVQRQLNH